MSVDDTYQSASIDLTVSIVNFNTRDMLDECLGCVFASERPITFEVIVIDNGSTDASVEMIKSKYPQARLIANDTNRYFSVAHNQALAVSRGRLFLILNSDIAVFSDTLRLVVSFMNEHPNVGVASCILLNNSNSVETDLLEISRCQSGASGPPARRLTLGPVPSQARRPHDGLGPPIHAGGRCRK